jgi:hypothetical protein
MEEGFDCGVEIAHGEHAEHDQFGREPVLMTPEPVVGSNPDPSGNRARSALFTMTPQEPVKPTWKNQ